MVRSSADALEGDGEPDEQSKPKLSEEMAIGGYPNPVRSKDLETGWYFWGIKNPEDCVLEDELELPRGVASTLKDGIGAALHKLGRAGLAGGSRPALESIVERLLLNLEGDGSPIGPASRDSDDREDRPRMASQLAQRLVPRTRIRFIRFRARSLRRRSTD